MRRARGVALLLAGWLLAAGPALAEDMTGTVLAVHDGDTLRVRVDCVGCPALFRVWGVRLLGVDAPELRDKRPDRAALAVEARGALTDLCPAGAAVQLRDVGKDKYGGRLLARVSCAGGRDAADTLKDMGLAREYWGRGKKPW